MKIITRIFVFTAIVFALAFSLAMPVLIAHAAVADATPPTVDTFSATSPSNSLDIPITAFTASDDIAVAAYMITESATPPLATDGGWVGAAPATFTVAGLGSHTLYPWAKDTSDNVSAVFGAPVTVSVVISPVLGSPAGTLTSWDKSFNWTGVPGATEYLLHIQTPAGAGVHNVWYPASAAGCDTGTTCSIIPPGLVLPNADYQWQITDHGAYGFGTPTALTSFTLNIPLPVTVPGEPAGAKTTTWDSGTLSLVSSWDYTYRWTGVEGATAYFLELKNAAGTVIFSKWYTAADAGCATGTTCAILPAVPTISVNESGSYSWRIQDSGPYGFGTFSAPQAFTMTVVPPAELVVLGSPTGTLAQADWDHSLNWTSIGGTDAFFVEVREVATNHVLIKRWVSTAAAACDTDLSCTWSPPELSALPQGSYRWNIMNHGLYGYGTPTAFTNFNLGPCYTLSISYNIPGSGTVTPDAQNCSGGYLPGTTVGLNAVPAAGFSFSSWGGAASGSANPTSVVVNGNTSVTGKFLISSVLGSPVGTLGMWDGSFNWAPGALGETAFLLNIQTTSGSSIYNSWVGAAAAGCDADLTCSIVPAGLSLAPGSYRWRVENYAPAYGYTPYTDFQYFTILACYSLTTPVSPAGSGTVGVDLAPNCPSNPAKYLVGTTVTLTATPGSGNSFIVWSNGASSSANPLAVTLNNNKTVQANFDLPLVLGLPAGAMPLAWDKSFNWTGTPGNDQYLLNVQMSVNGGASFFSIHSVWYTAAAINCDGATDFSCTLIPPSLSLARGPYQYRWRIEPFNSVSRVFGAWSAFQNFNLP